MWVDKLLSTERRTMARSFGKSARKDRLPTIKYLERVVRENNSKLYANTLPIARIKQKKLAVTCVRKYMRAACVRGSVYTNKTKPITWVSHWQ